MSEQQPETPQAAPEEAVSAPDETPDETPDTLPAEHSSGMEAADEMEEAQEEADEEAAQGDEQERQAKALTEKQVEKRVEKLENEARRHANRLGEILGEDFIGWTPCVLCPPAYPGWMPAGGVPEEVKARVRVVLGDRAPRVLLHDPHSTVCAECGGEGAVETGSKVESYAEASCMACDGRGVVGERYKAGGPMLPSARIALEQNGPVEQAFTGVDPPEVAELKRRGYVVLDPARA